MQLPSAPWWEKYRKATMEVWALHPPDKPVPQSRDLQQSQFEYCSYPRSGEETVLPLMLKGKEVVISSFLFTQKKKKVFFTVASWAAQRNTCPKSLAGAALYRLPPIMVSLRSAVSLQFLILTFFFPLGKTHVWLPNLGHHTWWQAPLAGEPSHQSRHFLSLPYQIHWTWILTKDQNLPLLRML